jgi:hypothetical protein
MNQLALFDYEQLDSETRIVVQQRTGEIKDLVRTTAENVVRIGEKLAEVRERLDNGRFQAWLSGEFDWSRRTAYNFISVYEQFGGDRAKFAQLDIATSALYLLAAPSTPAEARAEVLDRAEQGERITHSTAKEIVEEHKPPPPPPLPDPEPGPVQAPPPPPPPPSTPTPEPAAAPEPKPAPRPVPPPVEEKPAPPPPPPPPPPTVSAAPLQISLTVREDGTLVSARHGADVLAMDNCPNDQAGQRVQALIERVYGTVIEGEKQTEWLDE